jgi:hypothetical protein
MDFKEKVKALKLSWIARIIKNNNASWHTIPSIYFGQEMPEIFNYNNINCKIPSRFYNEIWDAWKEIKSLEEMNINAILS